MLPSTDRKTISLPPAAAILVVIPTLTSI